MYRVCTANKAFRSNLHFGQKIETVCFLLVCLSVGFALVCSCFACMYRSLVSCLFVCRSFDVSCVHCISDTASETGSDTKCYVFLACLFVCGFCSCVYFLYLHVQSVGVLRWFQDLKKRKKNKLLQSKPKRIEAASAQKNT